MNRKITKVIIVAILALTMVFAIACNGTQQTTTHTVAFNTLGGSAITSQTVVDGQTATRPANNPTRSGYDFVNWFTQETGGEEFDFATPITANITVYARWQTVGQNQVTLTFNTLGGSTVSSQIITSGQTATRPATDPTRSGYDFVNWFTQETGGEVFNFDAPITGATTIWARWQPQGVDPTVTGIRVVGGLNVSVQNGSDTHQLEVMIVYSNGAERVPTATELTFTSNNHPVATVGTNNGLLNIVTAGNAEITVTRTSIAPQTINLTVNPSVIAMTINRTSYTVIRGLTDTTQGFDGERVFITGTIQFLGETSRPLTMADMTITSNNPSVADITSNNRLDFFALGEATITVTSTGLGVNGEPFSVDIAVEVVRSQEDNRGLTIVSIENYVNDPRYIDVVVRNDSSSVINLFSVVIDLVDATGKVVYRIGVSPRLTVTGDWFELQSGATIELDNFFNEVRNVNAAAITDSYIVRIADRQGNPF